MTYVYRVGRHCGGQLCHLPESHNGSLHRVPGKPSIGHKWGVYCCLGCLQCKRLLFLVYLLAPLITRTILCQIVVMLVVNFTLLYLFWLFTECVLLVLLFDRKFWSSFHLHWLQCVVYALAALCWLVVCVKIVCVALLLSRLGASMWNQRNMENMSDCVVKCVILFWWLLLLINSSIVILVYLEHVTRNVKVYIILHDGENLYCSILAGRPCSLKK